jgi:NAD(P)-dependent dehydrogenase (short-subunit alcohol dehydrogenase family)
VSRPQLFISGGARGIGRAIAERFLAAGWRVGLGDADAETLRETVKSLGPYAWGAPMDVRSPTEWTRSLAGFLGPEGALDLLVNNAGVLAAGRFEAIDLASHARLVEINVQGVINGCHTALPWLRRARGARVINLASASAIYGQPRIASYSASKFFVRGFTEALNLEWSAFGIRVSALWPIFVKTAMVDAAPQMTAAKRLGVRLTPQDVAEVAFHTATRARPPVHVPIGFQTRAMRPLADWMPDAFTRRLVAYFARD